MRFGRYFGGKAFGKGAWASGFRAGPYRRQELELGTGAGLSELEILVNLSFGSVWGLPFGMGKSLELVLRQAEI